MNRLHAQTLGSRLFAGFGTIALLGAVGLAASRPAHTAGGPIPVTVANAPLPTTSADSPDKQAVQFEAITVIGSGHYGSSFNAYTVPAGKRLVIETVTAASNDFRDTNRYSISYNTRGGIGQVFVAGQFDLLSDGAPYPSAASHPHQYADAGTTVSFDVIRTQTSGQSTVAVVFTGYLVDTPAG